MLTGLVEPKLKIGRSTAPVGLLVIAAVKVTVPANPPVGDSVIVEAFPVVAPGTSVTDVPASVRPGGTAAVTVTDVLPETNW
jgi:hypothetical protein